MSNNMNNFNNKGKDNNRDNKNSRNKKNKLYRITKTIMKKRMEALDLLHRNIHKNHYLLLIL